MIPVHPSFYDGSFHDSLRRDSLQSESGLIGRSELLREVRTLFLELRQEKYISLEDLFDRLRVKFFALKR